MILDVESYPDENKRRFFGLKKNGQFYFTDSNNISTPFFTMTTSHGSVRLEGESLFIKLTSSNEAFNGKELLCGISIFQDNYVEIYNLKDKNMTEYLTGNIFGHITSNVFSFLKSPDNSENNYIITYILENNTSSYLIIKELKFSFDNSKGYKLIKELSFKSGKRRIVTCFFTVKLKYICFYQNKDNKLSTMVFSNTTFTTPKETNIYSPLNPILDNENKCLNLFIM